VSFQVLFSSSGAIFFIDPANNSETGKEKVKMSSSHSFFFLPWNLIVRLGRGMTFEATNWEISVAASQALKKPAPSSIAPCPTSHESKQIQSKHQKRKT
jgi:hypothetical protein